MEQAFRHGFARCAINRPGPMKVLIAEDETASVAAARGRAGRRRLRRRLRRATASAPTSSAQTERYDAVVLDLGLPKIDGLTLLRRWRDAGLSHCRCSC